MPSQDGVDGVDARLLLAIAAAPRATISALAEETGLSRNTVQSRVSRLEERGALSSFERRVDPRALGYPLRAFVTIQVTQSRLSTVSEALRAIPEVLEVAGISGGADLFVQVVARDTDDLYRIAGRVLAIPGVERTDTALVMRDLVDYRLTPLLERHADPSA
ncbi:Lrp/AsnC family transcriptional regulator [Saccharopolyspora gloriosae]|uniref:DNA-binding Lrp family transcriptional regulator n=1 Tax=Saccharopolyspora gloriosae TaxID=455344 RepID=A0A840NJH7_9PSEU|nr:DNA-binding Lrp family transcriptional regulator [Saccharopolyspora gloriosae]